LLTHFSLIATLLIPFLPKKVFFSPADNPDFISPARVPPMIFHPDGCGFYIRKN
jgi:hypothetical protein